LRIVALETLRPAIQPNVLLVQLHTDDGVAGLGEAFFGAGAVAAYLHDTAAPVLLGMEDPTPERAARLLAPYVGYQGGGVETRGNGAVDLALWDLLGKRARAAGRRPARRGRPRPHQGVKHLRRLGLRAHVVAAGLGQLGADHRGRPAPL
jgi:hypothetical protein